MHSFVIGASLRPVYTFDMATRSRATRTTARFEQRRDEILDVASEHMNALGVRGMTLTGVARELRIDTSSVTYYFRKKEDLAYACLDRTLVWQRDAAAEAAAATTTGGGIASFLHASIQAHRDRRASGGPHLAVLSDMHSLGGENREMLFARYSETVVLLRDLVERNGSERRDAILVTGVVLATVHWLSAWIDDYHEADFERVEARLMDMLEQGMGLDKAWPSDAPVPDDVDGASAQARFLHAATELINRDGYHGASVEKIAAELGVSTGSFYHHMDNKDELVTACFQRSYAMIESAGRVAEGMGGTVADQLARMTASLVRLQFEGESPLLRTSAYQALPPNLRSRMLRRNSQVTRHVAGLIADGISEGSVRAVDPAIAAFFTVSVVNAASDLRQWDGTHSFGDIAPSLILMLRRGICGLTTADRT